MKISLIIGLLSLIVLSSCSRSERSISSNEFIFPSIEVTRNGKAINENILESINADSLKDQYSGYVMGKYSIDEKEIVINEINPDKKPLYYSTINLDSVQGDGLQIKIDTAQLVVDPWYYYLLDKKTAFHPVILLNETSQTKAVSTITSRVLLLQEIYYEDHWVAINNPEVFNFCGNNGNNNSSILLESNEYILLNAPIYSGKDLVKMRVRIKSGYNLYVSQPYISRINLSQVYLTDFAKETKERYIRNGSLGESYWEKMPFFK